MVSKYPPALYSERTLRAVESAFKEVWATLSANDPQRVAENTELRVAVINRLLDLLEKGVRDPDELRTRTLSHFCHPPDGGA
jgi:hypothetical protein